MSKDPAVLFYTSDFLAGTSFFTKAQRGEYITLLCEQHQLWSIPEDHLIEMCGSLNSPVSLKFIKDKDGSYYNQRMRDETIKRKKYTESRRKNVAKRWSKNDKPLSDKKIDKIHMNIHMNEHMNIHMENGNDNINNTSINNKNKKTSNTSIPEWKKRCSTFEDYQIWEREEYHKIINDLKWIAERRDFHKPLYGKQLNITETIRKAHIDYWSTKRGYDNIKKRRGKSVDWKATWNNALTMRCNQVFDEIEKNNNSTDDIYSRN